MHAHSWKWYINQSNWYNQLTCFRMMGKVKAVCPTQLRFSGRLISIGSDNGLARWDPIRWPGETHSTDTNNSKFIGNFSVLDPLCRYDYLVSTIFHSATHGCQGIHMLPNHHQLIKYAVLMTNHSLKLDGHLHTNEVKGWTFRCH